MTVAALLPVTSSCEKWLEATSSSQIGGDKLFSSLSGFHEALIGVYLAMGDYHVYGRDYTSGFNDMVCVPYAASNSYGFKSIQQHLYADSSVERQLKTMWTYGYTCIANINKALFELENHRDIVNDDLEYNLMKGELLAARAYIHFDIMRMFGLESWSGDNASKIAVPYSFDYSSVAPLQHTYAETSDLIVKDIKDALECLKNDPVRGLAIEASESSVYNDRFWSDRQKRFNYYAVEALLARVSLWRRDFVTAGQLAQDVVQNTLSNGLVHWIDVDAFLEENEYDYRDWTFSCEHIFSLEVTNLFENVLPLFFVTTSSSGLKVDIPSVESMYISDFETGVDDINEDVRGPAGLLKYSATGYILYKFYGSDGYLEQFRSRMPMIKLPEMYLIMAEAALQAFDYDGALDYLDQIRFHRGVSTSIKLHKTSGGAVMDTQTELIASHILVEYLREMIGEGQFLYAFKRIAGEYGQKVAANGMVQSPINCYPVSVLEYPYPLEETIYGRVQDQ